MPSINAVHEEFEPRGLTVLLVDIQEDRAKVQKAVTERRYVAPVALDTDGEVSALYGVRGTPTTYVVGRDGLILGRAIGPRPWTGPDGRALLEALLGPASR